MKSLKNIAIAGNVLFIFWILYNGIDESGQGVTTVHAIAYIAILCLLALNAFMLSRK